MPKASILATHGFLNARGRPLVWISLAIAAAALIGQSPGDPPSPDHPSAKEQRNIEPACSPTIPDPNTSQIVSNSHIPDEDWHEVVNETDTPWDQYWILRKWAAEDAHFVRNVRLERLVTQPEWAELNDTDIVRLTADGLETRG